MSAIDRASDSIQKLYDRGTEFAADHRTIVSVLGAGTAVALGLHFLRVRDYRRKPGTSSLSGGSIPPTKLRAKYKDYEEAYSGGTITDRTRTTELVDTFYNMVTDMYEWGWGQSFHFSPRLPGKDWASSEAAHEARLPALLGIHAGSRGLDVGCGVGGPMRTIASTSGAHITGITINSYQVSRALYHNDKLGLAELCQPVQGDFLDMPFDESTFDGAYAIEATCHASKLEDVYAEVFRVLKPGARFASYEWVSTKLFDASNPEHVRIIDEINYGNGLPEMRSWQEAEEAGKSVGFRLVHSYDVATESRIAGPWYSKLKFLRDSHIIDVNAALVKAISFLHIGPRGLKDVHDMLYKVATSLVGGGETGVFSPMHLLVFEKPTEKPKAEKKPTVQKPSVGQ